MTTNKRRIHLTTQTSIQEIAEAIYTVNRHAKTAPEPQQLYHIKKEAIYLLLKEKHAKKIGMHFSDHPKLSNQHSTLLIQVANYYFHILPTKEDFEYYEHLGSLDHSYRNPRSKMPLGRAKRILYAYIGWKPQKRTKPKQNKQSRSAYYTPSSLGKMEWPPTKSHRHF